MSWLLDDIEEFEQKQSRRRVVPDLERQVMASQVNAGQRQNPDEAAKINRASRATGVPRGAYDADFLKVFEADERQRKTGKLLGKYPVISSWMAKPENAAVASDDLDNVGKLAKISAESPRVRSARRDFDTDGGFLEQAGDFIERRVAGLSSGWYRLKSASREFENDAAKAIRSRVPFFADPRYETPASEIAQLRSSARERETIQRLPIRNETTWQDVKARPSPRNVAKFIGQQGAASLPDMVAVMTSLSGYVMGRSGEMGQSRAENNGRADATIGDIAKSAPAATASALFERYGVQKIFKPGASTVAGRIGKAAGIEAGTEFIQSAIENAGETLGTDRGFSPAEALDEAVAGAVAGGGIGGGIRSGIETGGALTRGVSQVISRGVQTEGAREDAEILDALGTVATQSKTKARDPDAFASLLAVLGQEQGVDNVYFPASVVRQFMQDAPLDDHSFWDAYSDQMDDAEATGGDIVVPASEAIAKLSGTPAWEALKSDMRLSPGGISLREAEALDTETMDGAEDLVGSIADETEAESKRGTARQTLYDSVERKLLNAGIGVRDARFYAEYVTKYKEQRANDLGEELTGAEFDDTDVQSVLPEGLAPFVARSPDKPINESLRPVIEAMRGNKGERSESARKGPSLVDFLRRGGGIDDVGGDLAAMGFGKVKGVSRKNEKKLIRRARAEIEAGMEDMLGDDGGMRGGLDTAFDAAIEAGYFPELQGRGDTYADKPDIAVFLEALDREARGEGVYAPENDASNDNDQVRMAAQELAQLLDQQGIDPETATDKDITKAIERYQSAASEGRGLDQGLFDDPAQPQQTMTRAQRNELEARRQQSMIRKGGQKAISEQSGGLFDIARDQRTLFQSYGEDQRGRVTFANGRKTIDLFKSRDRSTFLHEMAHIQLEELAMDASFPDAPPRRVEMWETAKQWFEDQGHPVVDGVIPVEAHELWARGTERYLMEGKAPSTALRRIFERFRAWLVDLYGLAENLRAPISLEVRDVMARMLASDEEITAAREDQNLEALTQEQAKAIGMTDAEFAAYEKAATEARDESFDRMIFKAMAAIRAQRTDEYKRLREGIAKDKTENVNGRRVFQLLDTLRTGQKLDKTWLVDTYGADILKQLPRSVPPIFKDGGVEANLFAELYGYQTPAEMIAALVGIGDRQTALKELGDKRSAKQSIIDEETDEVMRERYGDIMDDGSIQEEALALVHSDRQGELLATELRLVARKVGQTPTPYRLAKQFAARMVAQGKVSEADSKSDIQRHARAATRASKAFQDAVLAGDFTEAARQKQIQMLNNALVAETKAAMEQIDKALARFQRYAKRRTQKSMDQDYLEQIHALLIATGLKQPNQATPPDFAVWIMDRAAEGHDMAVGADFAGRLGPWKDLSVETFRDLDDAVKQIAHLGREKKTIRDGEAKRDFDEAVDEAVDAAGKLPPKPPSDLMEPSRWDAITSRIADMDASLLKMETVFDWLDGGNPNGIFNRIAFRPIADAQAREKAMIADYMEQLLGHLKAIPKPQIARWAEKVQLPELINPETGNPFIMTREQLVSMALNMGNEGNIQRLVDGYAWDEQAVRDVLNRELTAADWTYVQAVWDTIETLWPETAAMERRVNGVEPEKVVSVPLDTPAGTMRGGYFPAIYDPRKSIDAEVAAAKSTNIFDTIYTKATTRASSTKDRATAVKRPIHLSLGVINRHVSEVIHDITHREVVMAADKFLGSRRVMKAVDASLGPAVRKQFRPWLQHIANEWAMDRQGVAGWDGFAKKLRTNTSLVGMGFRVSTIMMQVAGYSNSFERVGAKWVAPQIRKAVSPEAWRFVMERSPEVRSRMDTLERDINDNVRQLAGRRDLIADVRRFAYYGIGYMDRVVVVPTWLGAYNRAISEGMTEADAGYYADKTVRQSQGAGAAKDLAQVQRSNEWMRLATMFYSYQSAVYQRFRSLGRDVRHTNNYPDLLARSFWLLVIPPILAELLANRGPEDDEDWAMWSMQKMLVSLTGPIPIARDAVNALQSGFGYSFTPAARAFETGLNTIKDLRNIAEGDETNRATRNALELAGYSIGLPTGQLASAVQFIVDVSYDEADPEGVADWFEGLTKGKLKND